jgi:mRNA interferase RelE/StbE
MYSIEFDKSVKKTLSKLPNDVVKKILDAITELADDARPYGCEKLQSKGDYYRIRIGNYRVIYEINDGELTILVVEIGHRKEIYKKK